MKTSRYALLTCLLVYSTYAVPLPSSANPAGLIKYDQRQEGEINVRADLENFVILIIPTSSAGGGLGLFDLLSKALPAKALKRKHQAVKNGEQDAAQQNFIESKTAPYHVDISRSESLPKPQVEEILNGRPSKSEEKRDLGRFAKAILVTVPLEDEEPEQRDESRKIVDQLQLIGAEYEQCGPDGFRDAQGMCRYTLV